MIMIWINVRVYFVLSRQSLLCLVKTESTLSCQDILVFIPVKCTQCIFKIISRQHWYIYFLYIESKIGSFYLIFSVNIRMYILISVAICMRPLLSDDEINSLVRMKRFDYKMTI